MAPARSAAFFDLDRTLLAGGSGPVFAATFARLGVATPSIPGQDYLFKFFDVFGESFVIMQFARAAASRAKGLDRAMVQASAEIAADELLAKVQPYAREVMARHRADGELLVLATTSPFDLVSPFARRMGFDAVVATRYAEHEGIYTGELDGGFVWGPGKLAAVKQWAKGHDVNLSTSSAYSDSVFDAPMLGAVGHPFAVNPDARLRVLAAARRWPVRSLDAPQGVPSFNGVEPFDVVRTLLRPELFPFARFKFVGTNNIPRTGPAIIAANHRSYFDPLAIGLAVAQSGRNARFMGKKEVFDAPVVGQVARAMGAIRVDRGTGSDQPLLEAAAALNAGEVVVILPEGTIPRGEAFFDPILHGRLGVARLAAMCPDVPVVPLGVWGTESVWPRKSKVPLVWNVTKPPKVLLRAGPPVLLSRLKSSTADDLDAVMTAIMDLLPEESRVRREVSEADLAATVPNGDLSRVRTSGPRSDRGTSSKATAAAESVVKVASKPARAGSKPTKAGKAAKAGTKSEFSSAKRGAKQQGITLTSTPKASVRAGSTRPDAPSKRLSGSLGRRDSA
jgi:putative phosphoserine phosphatase / 1-acylglycerol-3-phosphate O-acyltransferase